MLSILKKFGRDESGVTAMEYGLIAALVALIIIGAVTNVGQELDKTFRSIATSLSNANSASGTSE